MAPGETPAGAGAPVRFSLSSAASSTRRPAPLPHRPQYAEPEVVVEYVTSVDTEAGFAVSNPRTETVRVVPTMKDNWPPENGKRGVLVSARSVEEMETLPEQATLERYEGLPVEEFGEALLRGMGWEIGQPIGRNATVVVAPVETVRRPGLLGLGAVLAQRRALGVSRASRAA